MRNPKHIKRVRGIYCWHKMREMLIMSHLYLVGGFLVWIKYLLIFSTMRKIEDFLLFMFSLFRNKNEGGQVLYILKGYCCM